MWLSSATSEVTVKRARCPSLTVISLTPPTGLACLTTMWTRPLSLVLSPLELAITNPTTATTTAAAITPKRARSDIRYLHRSTDRPARRGEPAPTGWRRGAEPGRGARAPRGDTRAARWAGRP